MVINEQLKEAAQFIIGNFKTLYLNDQGFIGRSYPSSSDVIYPDFDDIVPFFFIL